MKLHQRRTVMRWVTFRIGVYVRMCVYNMMRDYTIDVFCVVACTSFITFISLNEIQINDLNDSVCQLKWTFKEKNKKQTNLCRQIKPFPLEINHGFMDAKAFLFCFRMISLHCFQLILRKRYCLKSY